jgi:hypothetical protein
VIVLGSAIRASTVMGCLVGIDDTANDTATTQVTAAMAIGFVMAFNRQSDAPALSE